MADRSARGPEAPRDRASRSNFEMYSWIFMRLSGIVLVVLILGHLFVNLMLGGGVHQIDFALRRRQVGRPVLAGLGPADAVAGPAARHQRAAHDHQRLRRARRHPLLAEVLLYLASLIVIVLGTLVIFTFDPCPDPSSTLSVCQ